MAGAAICALAVATPASAGTIVYGLDDVTDNILLIDPTTGLTTGSFAAPVPFEIVSGLTIAEGGTSLLFTDNGNATGNPLYRLNPQTGAVLTTHALPISNRGGLSYDSSTNPDTILSINNGAPIISQSGFGGSTASIGPFGPSFPGALGGDDNGRHFVFFSGAISEIGLAGNTINSFALPGGGISGLAFDGVSLFASLIGGSTLWTLNPNTGAILNTVTVANVQFAGLAALSVHEPGTLALFGLGLAGLGFARRKRAA